MCSAHTSRPSSRCWSLSMTVASPEVPIPQVCPRRRRAAALPGGLPPNHNLVMSERTRNLPRRSCLSIPGSSEKMLGKGPGPPADLLLTQVEAKSGLPRGHIGIEAQIETARGLINVEEICAASPRLETIILGPVDFSASMEMPSLSGGLQIPEYPGDYFHYVFMKI